MFLAIWLKQVWGKPWSLVMVKAVIVFILFSDSGYLFSGSRPASQYKDSPPSGITTHGDFVTLYFKQLLTLSENLMESFLCFIFGTDYFSLKSGSRPSSPGPSPTPSVAGSVTSSSGSARQRRPLISPARLNISGQKLRLFSTDQEPTLMSPPVSPSHFLVEQSSSIYSGCFSRDISPFQSQNGKYSCSLIVKCSFYDGWSNMHICLVSFMIIPLDGKVKHSQLLHTMALKS